MHGVTARLSDGRGATRSRAQAAAVMLASALPFVAIALATLDSAAIYLASAVLSGFGGL